MDVEDLPGLAAILERLLGIGRSWVLNQYYLGVAASPSDSHMLEKPVRIRVSRSICDHKDQERQTPRLPGWRSCAVN
jgi:hypothetical protein